MPERRTREKQTRVFRIPTTRSWRVLLPRLNEPGTGSSSSLILIYGFAGVITIGTLLLMLPIASQHGQPASFVNALFTSTSATCVTGLVVVDTADYWSLFGQIIILILIQVGGFGFMTSATVLLLVFGRRIGLRERLLIRESMGLERLGGLTRMVRQIAYFTLIVEFGGTILFFSRFVSIYPLPQAIWQSIFQAVSAFNNAGFDLFGGFQSLASFQGDTLVILVTAVLIILGGISFLLLSDVVKHRKFRTLSLDSKLVLMTTIILLAVGTIVILLIEFNDPATLGNLSLPQKILNAFFQSVTARTAGFSTINMGSLATYGLFFTMLLMFIGGASGSTAGGIKINTLGILGATIWSTVRGKERAGAFGYEFIGQQVARALSLVIMALGLLFVVVFILTLTDPFDFLELLFETVSAFGTVGLTTGITQSLSTVGRFIITATMFVGRLGPLALVLSLTQGQQPAEYRYPKGVVRIG